MITLYIKPGCPYSRNVLRAIQDLEVPLEIKETSQPGVIEELIARGGMRQMPYMADSDTGTEMYESEDIILYLHQHFARK